FRKPVLRRCLLQAPFPFRPFSRLLGSPTAGIEPQPVEHTAPLPLGLLQPLGRRAAPEFQALEQIAALLSIAGEILARICTKILREIHVLVFLDGRLQSVRACDFAGLVPALVPQYPNAQRG